MLKQKNVEIIAPSKYLSNFCYANFVMLSNAAAN